MLNIFMFVLPFFLLMIAYIGIFINSQNMIRLLLCLEVIMLSLNLMVINLSSILNQPQLLILMPFFLALAAVEAAMGLGLLVVAYSRKNTLNFESFSSMKG